MNYFEIKISFMKSGSPGVSLGLEPNYFGYLALVLGPIIVSVLIIIMSILILFSMIGQKTDSNLIDPKSKSKN